MTQQLLQKSKQKMRKQKPRIFSGLNYSQIQCLNRQRRDQLPRETQAALKTEGYRNLGWENVIALYQYLEEILRQQELAEMSLESLFLEADRIGNQYLTSEEKVISQSLLMTELSKLEAVIEQQFPDTELEVVSFAPRRYLSRNAQRKRQR